MAFRHNYINYIKSNYRVSATIRSLLLPNQHFVILPCINAQLHIILTNLNAKNTRKLRNKQFSSLVTTFADDPSLINNLVEYEHYRQRKFIFSANVWLCCHLAALSVTTNNSTCYIVIEKRDNIMPYVYIYVDSMGIRWTNACTYESGTNIKMFYL